MSSEMFVQKVKERNSHDLIMILIACYYELTYTIKIKADKISYKASFVKAQLKPSKILLYALLST